MILRHIQTLLSLSQKSFSEGCEILLIDRPSIFHVVGMFAMGYQNERGKYRRAGKRFF